MSDMGYMREYESRRVVLESIPRVENLELTSYCNLRCVSCLPRSSRKQSHMPTDMLYRILDTNPLLGGQKIWVHFNGEPLAYPWLDGALGMMNDYGVLHRLSTNATLLDEEKSRILLGRDTNEIVFSVDGASSETYEKIRIGAVYEKTVENIKKFLELRREYERRPRVQVQMVESTFNAHETERFIGYWEGVDGVDDVAVKKYSTRGGNVADLRTDKEERRTASCLWPWRALVVLENADVVPCCTDMKGEMVLGNLDQSTIMEVWNSERMQNIRRLHIDGDTGGLLCGRCTDWEIPMESRMEGHRYKSGKFAYMGGGNEQDK